jgi:hypothetical protein
MRPLLSGRRLTVPLHGAVAKPKRLLADKAYGADSLRKWLKQRRIRAAIPSIASRRALYPLALAAFKAPKRHRTHVLQAEELADASQSDTTPSL